MIPSSNVKTLTPPYEIFEFVPAHPEYFKVVNYEIGMITIHPRWAGAPPSKQVLAVRLHVDPSTKPYYPHYWDITPSRLVHQLSSLLVQGVPPGMWLRIERDIPGPKAHFAVSWVQKPP